jgi:hypothetical protein
MDSMSRIAAFAICFASPLFGQNAAARVCMGHWSAPFPVMREGELPVYIERGVVTPFGDRTLALGAPTFYWLSKSAILPASVTLDTAKLIWSFTRSGALIDSHGLVEAVPWIDSLRPREKPSLIGWSRGRADVVWNAVVDAQSKEFNAIELSSFNGRTWSAPQIVLRGRDLRRSPMPAFRAEAPFDIAVVGSIARDSNGAVLRIARRSNGQWTTGEWRDAVFLHWASAFPETAGSIPILFMGYAHGEGLFSIRATFRDDAVRWSAVQRIDTIPTSFSAFASARLGGDSLLVVWYRSASGYGERGLMTALSVDGGESWKHTQPLIPSSSVSGETLVVDATGRVHVLYRGAAMDSVLNAPGGVMHSMWVGGQWTSPITISSRESLTDVSAGPAPGGRVMAMWTEAVEDPRGLQPKSIASVWNPGCGG